MKSLLRTASCSAVVLGLVTLGTADVQAQVRVPRATPNQAVSPSTGAGIAPNIGLGGAAGYRSATTRTMRQGMTVRGANYGNFNGLNYGAGPFGAYPGMYGGAYPGMYGGAYPGMYGGAYPGMYGGMYPGMYGGVPGMFGNPYGY